MDGGRTGKEKRVKSRKEEVKKQVKQEAERRIYKERARRYRRGLKEDAKVGNSCYNREQQPCFEKRQAVE